MLQTSTGTGKAETELNMSGFLGFICFQFVCFPRILESKNESKEIFLIRAKLDSISQKNYKKEYLFFC